MLHQVNVIESDSRPSWGKRVVELFDGIECNVPVYAFCAREIEKLSGRCESFPGQEPGRTSPVLPGTAAGFALLTHPPGLSAYPDNSKQFLVDIVVQAGLNMVATIVFNNDFDLFRIIVYSGVDEPWFSIESLREKFPKSIHEIMMMRVLDR